jgi:3-oxoacyl-(acyl-carrier-protein) synthase/pimeloyl-ACP methyl ester carboxylesterase
MEDQLADDTPVVVGMDCRFAGSDGLAEYWSRLHEGRSALGATDRWPGEDGDHVGGFLDGHREFDARYFRISPNEARCMDPQQRLLLQSVQLAVDDSYLTTADLQELRCGVFVAGLPGDYRTVVAQAGDVAFGTHSFLGNAPSTLSGRVSYFYDVTGPSITFDSACSSSLTALHQALLNVRSGDCRCAIVGAVSVFSTPEVLRFAQRSRMSSPTGACLPFTDAADGFVPAEGVAAVVVMRHDEARARGLRVYGAVVATGTNHNGTTNGLMAPSARAQAELIVDTYQRAGIDPTRIAYVETHGTGTPLGDPIELAGLRSAFDRVGGDGCYLGAVKPIIGHTLVCSGLAGVIKALLGFQHGTIPPAVATDEPVSYLDVAPFTVNQDPVPWPADQPLCAISAFGFTGTNGHVVLRGVAPSTDRAAADRPERALPFCLSADSDESLRELVARYRALAETVEDDQLWDLSQLLLHRPARGRQHVVVARGRAELRAALDVGEPGLNRLDDDLRRLVSYWQACDTAALRPHLDPPAALARLALPGYPFEKRSYWVLDDAQATSAPPVDDALTQRLCADLSALLGHGDGPDRVVPAARIATLGLDSLSAVQLLTPYQQEGSTIKGPDLFRCDTVADLAAAIGGQRHETTPGLRWREHGAGGQAAVLLPPLNSDERAWVQQITALVRAGRHVYVPEYPGHGDAPFDAASFSLEYLADEVAEFLSGLPDGQVDLVGWSLGACVSVLTALRHPERVRSLVLISGAPRYGTDVFERTVDLRHELRTHSGLLEAVFDKGGDLVHELAVAAPMTVLRDYYAALSTFDIVDQLPDLDTPCLVVRGGDDCVVDADAAALFSRLPRSRVREVARHGHYVPLTAGPVVNEALTEFWTGQP